MNMQNAVSSSDSQVTVKKDLPNPKSTDQRIRIALIMTSCKRVGPAAVTLNIIKYLDQNIFRPILITLYDEDENSMLSEYLQYISDHRLVRLNKADVLLHRLGALKTELSRIQPDIVYTVGVFPNYAVSKIGCYKHVFTLHNYMYDDYITLYGKIRGHILVKMQLSALKMAEKVVACSQSLAQIYEQRLGLKLDYIRNGVDTEHFLRTKPAEKEQIRQELGLPDDAFTFIYTGSFIARKNLSFLLEGFTVEFKGNSRSILLLVGDGPLWGKLRTQYANNSNIIFCGKTDDVGRYLKASDAYVSMSKSEGMPMSVLEAMATGLPVVLSDIPQHREVFEINEQIGVLVELGNVRDLSDKLNYISTTEGITELANNAYETAHGSMSASQMSKQYQSLYQSVIDGKIAKL